MVKSALLALLAAAALQAQARELRFVTEPFPPYT